VPGGFAISLTGDLAVTGSDEVSGPHHQAGGWLFRWPGTMSNGRQRRRHGSW